MRLKLCEILSCSMKMVTQNNKKEKREKIADLYM